MTDLYKDYVEGKIKHKFTYPDEKERIFWDTVSFMSERIIENLMYVFPDKSYEEISDMIYAKEQDKFTRNGENVKTD